MLSLQAGLPLSFVAFHVLRTMADASARGAAVSETEARLRAAIIAYLRAATQHLTADDADSLGAAVDCLTIVWFNSRREEVESLASSLGSRSLLDVFAAGLGGDGSGRGAAGGTGTGGAAATTAATSSTSTTGGAVWGAGRPSKRDYGGVDGESEVPALV